MTLQRADTMLTIHVRDNGIGMAPITFSGSLAASTELIPAWRVMSRALVLALPSVNASWRSMVVRSGPRASLASAVPS